MHFHVTRTDYDTRNGHESDPVEIGTAPTFRDCQQLTVSDAKQFRNPSADRFILHQYARRQCSEKHS